MGNKILIKKSSVAAKVPLTGDLDYGELAINYTDEKLYFKNASNAIKSLNTFDVITLGTPAAPASVLTTESTTVASVSTTVVGTFALATYGGAKYLVQVRDTVTGARQLSELLITHDGTTAYATEYGVVTTGAAALATFTVDVSGGNVRVLTTRTTANSTQYKINETLMII